jgi:hypothetical protein
MDVPGASISFRCKIPHKVTLSFEAYSDYFAGTPNPNPKI